MDTTSTYHAKSKMRTKIVKDVATPTTIKINRIISRCNDVIGDDMAEASFAVRPLIVSCIRRETLDLDKDREYERDSVVADLKDETGA